MLEKNHRDMASFVTAPKRKMLKSISPCPNGYLFVRSATKQGEILAFPKDEFTEYPCLLFKTAGKSRGGYKSFKVKVDDQHSRTAYESYPEQTIERQVALSYKLIIVAETIENQDKMMVVTRIVGDKFLDQHALTNLQPVTKFTLVSSNSHFALVGGMDDSG